MHRKTEALAKMVMVSKREVPKKDFQYVVQRPGKPRLCFGSSLNRDELKPVSRFEIQYSTHPGPLLSTAAPTLGIAKSVSSFGTIRGGRTAPRELPPSLYQTPPPGAYSPKQISRVKPATFGKCPRRSFEPKHVTVGPGYYDVTAKHRELIFAHTFGGKRFLVPAVQTKCTPTNNDTCEKCKKYPAGDYWKFNDTLGTLRKGGVAGEQETWYLCRPCYQKEKRKPTLFTRHIIQQFKKTRDCSQIHFHDGCEARLLLLPPRDIEKITEKEAYFSLYFP